MRFSRTAFQTKASANVLRLYLSLLFLCNTQNAFGHCPRRSITALAPAQIAVQISAEDRFFNKNEAEWVPFGNDLLWVNSQGTAFLLKLPKKAALYEVGSAYIRVVNDSGQNYVFAANRPARKSSIPKASLWQVTDPGTQRKLQNLHAMHWFLKAGRAQLVQDAKGKAFTYTTAAGDSERWIRTSGILSHAVIQAGVKVPLQKADPESVRIPMADEINQRIKKSMGDNGLQIVQHIPSQEGKIQSDLSKGILAISEIPGASTLVLLALPNDIVKRIRASQNLTPEALSDLAKNIATPLSEGVLGLQHDRYDQPTLYNNVKELLKAIDPALQSEGRRVTLKLSNNLVELNSVGRITKKRGQKYHQIRLSEAFIGEAEGRSRLFPVSSPTYLTPDDVRHAKGTSRESYIRPREELELLVKDGMLVDVSGKLFDTSEGKTLRFGWLEMNPVTVTKEAIFAIDENGRMFGSLVDARTLLHHSSLLGGGPALFVGSIQVKNGVPRVIRDFSGHYSPPLLISRQGKLILKEKGVEVNELEEKFLLENP